MSNFHKPVKRPGDVLELMVASGDPADANDLAHDTAAALLNRVRRAEDQGAVERVIEFADRGGIEDLAELWSEAEADTLPGALWRLYLVRHAVRSTPSAAGYRFRRGTEVDTVNQAIAGSPPTPSPDEVVRLATDILRGAFTGDFAVALERAAAFMTVMAAGSRELIAGGGPQERLAQEESRAIGYERLAVELKAEARLWRTGDLR